MLLNFFRASSRVVAKLEHSRDEHLSQQEWFLMLFLSSHLKMVQSIFIWRLRKNVKADSGIVFDSTFPVSVMDFLIDDIFQLRKVASAEWDLSG